MADLLSPEDLAYMRSTQAEARPTTMVLQRYRLGRGPGGDRVSVAHGEPEPLAARVWHEPDDVPAVLADRYEGGTLCKVHMDQVHDVRDGDRLVDAGTGHSYELVSDGEPDAWATSQPTWARRLDRPERTP